MKYRLLFFSGLLIAASSFAQQSTEDSVKEVVTKMFDAMRNADPAGLKAVFAENVVFHSISTAADGGVKVTIENPAEFIDFVSKEKKGNADERIVFETILLDGPLAMVWTPYQFYYKGVFSHCGVDSFQLVKINGNWKIQYIIDTRRKTGCK